MSLPIIFLNYGNPWYLKYSLSQCIGTNPGARVILLGDNANIGYAGVEHYNCSDYMHSATKIAEVYKHMNTNPYDFELFCMQRWFIISDFLQKHSIKECFVMDSDVLLYEPIVKYRQVFEKVRMTLHVGSDVSVSASAHSTYILDRSMLQEFCAFCLSTYANEEGWAYKRLLKHCEGLKQANESGGVCDMTFWYLFYIENKEKIYDLNSIIRGDECVDNNVNAATNNTGTFKIKNGIKQVRLFRDKAQAFIVSPLQHSINMISLHFQGSAKKLIPEYITYKGYYYWYNIHYISLKNKIRSLLTGR